MQRAEKSHKWEGILIAAFIHAAILIVFFYFYLLPPNPPLSEIRPGGGGIEMGFGDPGGNMVDVSDLLASNSSEVTPTENVEEVSEETEPTESTEELDEHGDEEINKAKEEKKTVEKKVENPVKKKEEEQPKVDERFTFNKNKGNKNGGDVGTGNGKNGGDGTGTGDGTGNGNGTGNGDGKGSGSGFSMDGDWQFVGDPYPDDKTDQSGVLKLRLHINSVGRITMIETVSAGPLRPSTIELYKRKLMQGAIKTKSGQKIPTTGAKVSVSYNITAQ